MSHQKNISKKILKFSLISSRNQFFIDIKPIDFVFPTGQTKKVIAFNKITKKACYMAKQISFLTN